MSSTRAAFSSAETMALYDIRSCYDHLAGRVAVVLGWVAPLPKTRALRITHRGARELEGRFGIVAHA